MTWPTAFAVVGVSWALVLMLKMMLREILLTPDERTVLISLQERQTEALESISISAREVARNTKREDSYRLGSLG